MKISEEKMSLANLADGAAIERFDIALQEVANNIQDVNTEATAVREVVLSVKIKPDEDRNIGGIEINALPKLAKFMPVVTKAFLGKDIKGDGEIYELSVPKQMDLFQNNVTMIKKEMSNA